MQQVTNPAKGATFSGQGYATTCTLAQGTATYPAGLPVKGLRAAVVAYLATNPAPAGQQAVQGPASTPLPAKGSAAYYRYLAWYHAVTQGSTTSSQGNVYTNAGQAHGYPLGNQAGTQPGRASQHGWWLLAKHAAPAVAAAYAAGQANQAAG